MKLAFCLFHYFPFGGLQRDFLRIARACVARGHSVDVYTLSWEGPLEAGLSIKILPASGWQNHSRCRSFARELQKQLAVTPYDLIVGFNKMPGLDVYYAADVCYQYRIQEQRPFWYRWLPRYRHYRRAEAAVFSAQAQTQILVLSAVQGEAYSRCYNLPQERFHLLPPGIARDRLAPANAAELRRALRQRHQVAAEEHLLLMVASGFKTKGLDRALHSLAALPAALRAKTRLWVLGQDNPAPFLRLAKELKVANRLYFWGGQHEVIGYYLAADLLLHPAYHENTGTVLLEALAAGLPVLTLDVCGYAPYVREAKAGIVLPSPFDQATLNQQVENMLLSPARAAWQNNGLAFAKSADIFSLPEKAVAVLESLLE
jgi:UDP-glucose:(heptosyl)LPS alpha-1,3-glucosyltransferase